MNSYVGQDKYYPCPDDSGWGILLVDIETETDPVTDEDGNSQYYCTEGDHIFSVAEGEDDDD